MERQETNNWEEKKIVVYQGDENRARVRDNIQDSSYFFSAVYDYALQVVQKICDASKEYFFENHMKKYDNKECDETDTKILGYTNNFILFSAGRGAGKTSAMITFANALKKNEYEFDDKKFMILSEIDPTVMEEKDSILKMIISRMFVNVRCKWNEYKKDRDADYYEDKKNQLLKLFQECYRDIDILKQQPKQDDIYDDLLKLSELGDSTHLKARMYTLIKEYLSFLSGDGKVDNQFLVIQIDDVDLNTRKVYEILEDLRKYFILPNVIVLMAADIEQLRLALERNYIEEYEILIRHGINMGRNICREMAERYIEKLFPVIHQVHLPEIDDAIMEESQLISLEYKDKKEEINKLVFKDSQGEPIKEYQYILLRCIYNKTGLMLTSQKNLHNLLPRKMRELTHFLEYMDVMQEVEANSLPISAKKHYENLKRLEEYLEEYWSPYYLTKQQLEYYVDFKERYLGEKQELCSGELWKLLLGEKEGKKNESKDIEIIETKLNQVLINGENIPNRKLIELMLTFLSIQRNKKALLNFRRGKYLIGSEKLFMEGSALIRLDSQHTISSDFKITYVEFQNIIKRHYGVDRENSFVEQNINMFIRGNKIKKFDIFGLLSYYASREISVDSMEREQINAYFSIFDIVTNNDLKREIYRKLTEETIYDEFWGFRNPVEIVWNIYEKIDEIVNSYTYFGGKSNTAYFLKREKGKSNPIITAAFIFNSEMMEYYFKAFKKLIIKNIRGMEFNKKADASQYQKVLTDIMYVDIKGLNTPRDLGIDEIMLEEKNMKRLFEENERLKQPLAEFQSTISQNMGKGIDADLFYQKMQEWISEYNEIVKNWRTGIEKLVFEKEKE